MVYTLHCLSVSTLSKLYIKIEGAKTMLFKTAEQRIPAKCYPCFDVELCVNVPSNTILFSKINELRLEYDTLSNLITKSLKVKNKLW